MPDGRRVTCRHCGRHAREVGPISWRGKCGDCGTLLATLAMDDLHYHQGPIFKRWRQRSAAALGAVLLDDLDPEP